MMSDFDYVVVVPVHKNFVRSQKTKENLERARSVPYSIDIEERGNLWLYFSADQREKLKEESRLTYEDHGTAEVDLYRQDKRQDKTQDKKTSSSFFFLFFVSLLFFLSF
jgi:hypothetical protein